jgi:protein ImuB
MSSSLPSRVAVVEVPSLLVQAARRADPALEETPLVILDEARAVSPLILAASDEARAGGVAPGMVLSQARALVPELVARGRSRALERSAVEALLDLGASFSPRVELVHAPPTGEGEARRALERPQATLAIDVSDLGRLFPSEGQLATALHLGARRLGLDGRVGLARDKVTARVAARSGGGVTVVPAGREAAFLARLPIALLDPSDDVRDALTRFGVRLVGELADLPAGGVALRLGAEGARLAEVARGEAAFPLVPRPEAARFEEAVELEWPVDNTEALGFALRRLVDNLMARLACRALAASAVTLTCTLDPASVDVTARAGARLDARTIAIAAPTRDPQTVWQLARAALERSPPTAPVTALSLVAACGRARPAQLGLFDPPGPSPDKLATLLARLAALVGDGRVGAPELRDAHVPERMVGVHIFSPRPAPASAPTPAAAPEAPRALALHAYRPPVPATVRCDRGAPRVVESPRAAGYVVDHAGPFRLRDAWWQSGGEVSRDYYDVELSDGAVYRLFRDLLSTASDAWFIDGVYE